MGFRKMTPCKSAKIFLFGFAGKLLHIRHIDPAFSASDTDSASEARVNRGDNNLLLDGAL
jgi:hypothetical protein